MVLYLHCQRPCTEVTLRGSRACRFRRWQEHAVTCLRAHNAAFCRWRESAVTCRRAHTAVADSERPEEQAMERRAVGRFRRAAEPCESASCPALIALIDRRGKHKLPCYGLKKRRRSSCSRDRAFRWRTQVHTWDTTETTSLWVLWSLCKKRLRLPPY